MENLRELFRKAESLEERLKREGYSRKGVDMVRELVNNQPKTIIKMPDLPTVKYDDLLRPRE
ncbi:hypothetical protein ABE38_05600 [Brevibacillus agri]|nr:hypothetical protein [Brevibacillus agri]